MAEQAGYDEDERAWAVRVARAFLAPSALGVGRAACGEAVDAETTAIPEGRTPNAQRDRTPSTVVLAVAVVPLPVPHQATGGRRQATEGDEEPEEERDG